MTCSVCDDTRFVSNWVIQSRPVACTCGARKPGVHPELILHKDWCDPVPCPFCQLADEMRLFAAGEKLLEET